MPNLAAILKSEIARVARKEVRAETQSLKKAIGNYRSEIAELKRRSHALERELRRIGRASHAARLAPEPAEEAGSQTRFSAKGFASHRKRLGLSAAECAMLIGASALSVYKWENGHSRPRSKFLPAIVAFRALGKREVAARLEAAR